MFKFKIPDAPPPENPSLCFMKYLSIVLYFILNSAGSLHSQSKWEVYAGANHSNILHILEGQPILYAHTLNAPHWNYGFQFGINRVLWESNRISLCIGGRFQMKGDKDSVKDFSPNAQPTSLRFIDFMIPLNLQVRLLSTKPIFFKTGISTNYLLYQSKIYHHIRFFDVTSFDDKFAISGQLGIKANISKRFSLEAMYSQSLDVVYEQIAYRLTDGSMPVFEYKHQAFEISILYAL